MNEILKKISKCKTIIPVGAILFCVATYIVSLFKLTVNTDLFLSDKFGEWLKILKDFCTIGEKYGVVLILIFSFSVFVLLLKLYYKNKTIKILFVNTFKNNNSKIITKYTNEDLTRVDLSNEVELLSNDYQKYSGIVKRIDDISKKFMESNENNVFAFGGIMHTPLILRLGYEIGDETYFKLLHKKRNDDSFKLLKDNKTYVGNYPAIKIIEKNVKDSSELIVSIATTFEITNEKLKKFDIDKNSYIKFQTETLGFDIIESEEQIEHYKKIIFKAIREMYKEKEIKVIHLCISSSVAFTFALGQGFSENYDPKIIIYNYEKQEYVWGLNLFEKSDDCIVSVESQSNVNN